MIDRRVLHPYRLYYLVLSIVYRRFFTLIARLKYWPSLDMGIHCGIERGVRLKPFLWMEGRLKIVLKGRNTIGQHTEIQGCGRLEFGERSVCGPFCVIGCIESVTIGKDVLIAPAVLIMDIDHVFSSIEAPIAGQGFVSKPVVIEDGVWIGYGASILKGVTVGRGSVVGAGAVVTKDVPPFSVVAGVPARVVKWRKGHGERDKMCEEGPGSGKSSVMTPRGQTEFVRGRIFAMRKASRIIGGLRPTAIKGRFRGPRVLMNSIPKSGTNLMENALNNFPLMRNGGWHTLGGWLVVDYSTIGLIKDMGRGEFLSAHLPAHKDVVALLRDEGIKSLLMIRDPRDIVVSHFNYVTYIDLTHVAHRHFSALPDDDARLMASIRGVEGCHASVRNVLESYVGWLDDKNTLVVRFEDLIGPAGGGDDLRQFRAVRDMARHIGVAMSDDEARKICSIAYSAKGPTFRSGKKGGWRGVFKEEHVKAFKELAGDYLIRYGYEAGNDWG